MEQPFAPRAAAPKGELRKSGDVTEVWAAKVEGASEAAKIAASRWRFFIWVRTEIKERAGL